MDNENKDRMPRQLGKTAAESRGREDTPAPKRRMETRTADVESEYEGSGEEYYTEVAENSKIIRVLMKQMCGLQKTVMERLPEQKGR